MPKPASPQFLATLGRTIEEGVALQRQGKLAEAEKIYTRILKTLPDQFETLQLLAELETEDHVVRFCNRDIGLLDRAGGFRRFAPPRAGLCEPPDTESEP